MAHDFWSAAWIVSLTIFGAITLAGRKTVPNRILFIMAANFLATRTILFFDLPDFLWVKNDLVTTLALALCGRTVASKACSALFFIILQFDLAMFFGFAGFASVAAVSDLLGYIILVVMAGAAHDIPRGRLFRRRGVSAGVGGIRHPLALGRAAASRHASDH
jgi:hypothetical protein